MAINQIFSLRGATTVSCDTQEEIVLKTTELIAKMIQANQLSSKQFEVYNVFCTTTSDITSFYPVRALRESGLLDDIPLFSGLEPPMQGALKKCIRFMLQVTNSGERVQPKHIYLHGATAIRKDLVGFLEEQL